MSSERGMTRAEGGLMKKERKKEKKIEEGRKEGKRRERKQTETKKEGGEGVVEGLDNFITLSSFSL